jgi:hypothetical protein
MRSRRSRSDGTWDEQDRLLYAAGFEQIKGGLWESTGALYTKGAALRVLREQTES